MMSRIDAQPDPPVDDDLPAELREALRRLHDPEIVVPPEVDHAILSAARAAYERRLRTWRAVRWAGSVAATAAVIALGLRAFTRHDVPVHAPLALNRPRLAQLADVNHDGRVDILDAYVLARKIARHEPLDPAWDVNGDGVVDQADVDLIAGMAVHVQQEQAP